MGFKQLKRNSISGTGEDVITKNKRIVLNGELIFFMMDSQGIPFDFLMDMLKEKQLSYNVETFIKSAYNSKNYSKEKLRMLFEYNKPKDYESFMTEIDNMLNRFWGE